MTNKFLNLSSEDTIWILSLYGTAIGAGTLFLPINVGIGGIWLLAIVCVLAFPLTYFSHRALTRFVLSGSSKNGDITDVAEEHFGKIAGKIITVLYFLSIYPVILVYSVAVTNTINSFLEAQLNISPPPRVILAGISVFSLMLIVSYGKNLILKTMSYLVFPFVFSLIAISLYLIPQWDLTVLQEAKFSNFLNLDFLKNLWLAAPVMVFSFNHSPIISSFAVSQKKSYDTNAEPKSNKILALSHILMVSTVLFFVISCVLSLSSNDLVLAKDENISILSFIALHQDNLIFFYVAPIIALIAISKSFLGHYLGAKEGLDAILIKSLQPKFTAINFKLITAILLGTSAWLVATINPSILSMIETMCGPILALILFIIPLYAIRHVPNMQAYKGKLSNVFLFVVGIGAISSILYSTFS